MNKPSFLIVTAVLAGSLFAADFSPKDEIAAAAKKLGEQASYRWETTATVPGGFRSDPSEGTTEKDGFTYLSLAMRTGIMGDNFINAAMNGDKTVINKPMDESCAAPKNLPGWQSIADMERGEESDRSIAMMVRNFKKPTVHAPEIAGAIEEFTKDGDAWTGEMKEDCVKSLLSLGYRAGSKAPVISGAKGSAKFWLKDGVLAKYEFKVSGKMSFNGKGKGKSLFDKFPSLDSLRVRDVDGTTTVEIKDIGTTKVEVPEKAKMKLE